MNRILLVFVLLSLAGSTTAQVFKSPFSRIELYTDTLVFNSSDHVIEYNRQPHLYFLYEQEDQVVELYFYPGVFDDLTRVSLTGSAEYDILDSLIWVNQEYYRARVRFRNLSQTDFLKLLISFSGPDSSRMENTLIPLLPYTLTFADMYSAETELYIGEEKTFEITSNHPQNIRVNSLWSENQPVNYRMSYENGRLLIHTLSKNLGSQELNVTLQTIKPYIDENGKLQYDLPVISRTLKVKESRLRFLDIGAEDIMLDADNRDGYLVQLESHPFFSLQKTYRVEGQEEAGGALIAELFTISYLSNSRILCRIRPYSYHRKSDGYLYIKEGDVAKFIFNLNIIPKTSIQKISVLREGADWTTDLSVYPGESVEVKIEGSSLQKGSFVFEGLSFRPADSLTISENVALFHFRIPFRIQNTRIPVYINGNNSGWTLNVKEYQRPKVLDFVFIESGGWKRSVDEINSVVMTSNVIQDIVFSFDPDKIDTEGRLFGKQHLQVLVTIRGKNNELLEMQTLDNIVICPGIYSPRHAFYSDKNCTPGSISLNRYLSKKTYDLEEWSRIILEVRHKKEVHGGEGFSKTIDIILERTWRFDIDVSFPAGLLIFGGEDSGNLTGISMAMLAQFSFYEKNRINRFKPYKVGAGFIAIDAFNFSENNENRDVALVVLGSLYPTRKDSKLTFPLYFGAGFKLIDEQFFFMIGPGIRVSL